MNASQDAVKDFCGVCCLIKRIFAIDVEQLEELSSNPKRVKDMDPSIGVGIASCNDCVEEVLYGVYEWLDLFWAAISDINERLYIHSHGRKDPH